MRRCSLCPSALRSRRSHSVCRPARSRIILSHALASSHPRHTSVPLTPGRPATAFATVARVLLRHPRKHEALLTARCPPRSVTAARPPPPGTDDEAPWAKFSFYPCPVGASTPKGCLSNPCPPKVRHRCATVSERGSQRISQLYLTLTGAAPCVALCLEPMLTGCHSVFFFFFFFFFFSPFWWGGVDRSPAASKPSFSNAASR